MLNPKRSFLLYFDNAPMINDLPAEQRGWLFSALLDYGERVSREELTAEAALALYPRLDPKTRMLFQFIAAAIERDTRRWLCRRQAVQERRQQAREKEKAQEAVPRGSAPSSQEREEADRTLLRRALEQVRDR